MLMVIDTPAGNAPLRKIEPLITLWDRLTPEAKRLDARAARLRRMRYWLRRIGQERRKSFGDQLRWAGTVITRTTRELARGRGTSVISGGVPTTPAVMDEIQREEANLMQGIAGGIGRTTLQHYSRAAVSYIPQPYDGRVVVFLAVPKIGQKRLDPTAGWGQVSREVILHEMESTHVGLVTRELTMFAQRFAEIIRSERC
jgi:hypothetical protein